MALESPVKVLYNSEGQELAVSQSQVVSGSLQPGLLLAASSSQGTATFLKATDDGTLFVTGSFAADVVMPATQSVNLVSINTDVTASVLPLAFASSSLSSAIASTTPFDVLGENPNRKVALFYADGNRTWYLAFNADASNSLFTVKLASNAFFEVPERFTGRISAVANANGGGTLMITEISLP